MQYNVTYHNVNNGSRVRLFRNRSSRSLDPVQQLCLKTQLRRALGLSESSPPNFAQLRSARRPTAVSPDCQLSTGISLPSV